MSFLRHALRIDLCQGPALPRPLSGPCDRIAPVDLSPENQQALQRAAQILGASHYVVALSGAGMSAESGIPTYRGPGGLWTRIGEPDPRSYYAFIADPKAWWERTLGIRESHEEPERVQFRQAIEEAEPNPGHYALADLEAMGLLKHTITQNVDGLHREAGSRSLSEIHGNRTPSPMYGLLPPTAPLRVQLRRSAAPLCRVRRHRQGRRRHVRRAHTARRAGEMLRRDGQVRLHADPGNVGHGLSRRRVSLCRPGSVEPTSSRSTSTPPLSRNGPTSLCAAPPARCCLSWRRWCGSYCRNGAELHSALQLFPHGVAVRNLLRFQLRLRRRYALL